MSYATHTHTEKEVQFHGESVAHTFKTIPLKSHLDKYTLTVAHSLHASI